VDARWQEQWAGCLGVVDVLFLQKWHFHWWVAEESTILLVLLW
jgi:hypothetical protein